MIVDIHALAFRRNTPTSSCALAGARCQSGAALGTAMRRTPPPAFRRACSRWTRPRCVQVLSPAASPPYADKEADAVAARAHQRQLRTLAQRYPGKLAAFVSLPLPIDASLREMERGLDQLGMLGVSMTCSASTALPPKRSSSRSTRR